MAPAAGFAPDEPGDGDAPLVSVVIPTRDRRDLVAEAVASALAQDVDDLEVVVVDDGSSDGTVERLSEIGDGRLRVLSIAAGGASQARNAGIEAARGRYVAFLDSDDLFEPAKLAQSLARLESDPGMAFVHTYWEEVVLATGRRAVQCPAAAGDARHDLLMFSQIATPTVVCRKAALEVAGGFAPDLTVAEDYDLWCRLARVGRVGLVTRPLTRVRVGGGGARRDPRLIVETRLRIVDRYFASGPLDGVAAKRVYVRNALLLGAVDFARRRRFAAALGCGLRGLFLARHRARRAPAARAGSPP